MNKVPKLILGVIAYISVLLPNCIAEDANKIGIILPLSGSTSSWGAGLQSAALMAYGKLPQETRDKVELIFEDDKFDSKTAISAFQYLTEQKDVKAIIVFGSNSALAIAPLAEKIKIPVIALGLSPKIYQGREWLIQHWVQVKPLAEKILQIAKDKDVKHLSILTSEHESYESIKKELISNALNVGINILTSETIPLESKDLTYLLPKLLKMNEGTLAVCLLPEQNKAFAALALKSKLKLDLIGCNGLDTPILSEGERKIFSNVSYPAVAHTDHFLRTFTAENPNKEWIGAGDMYDAVSILSKALSESSENIIVLAEIKKSQTESFAFGSYNYNPEGFYEVPIKIKKL